MYFEIERNLLSTLGILISPNRISIKKTLSETELFYETQDV